MAHPEHLAPNPTVAGEYADISFSDQHSLREYLRTTERTDIPLYRDSHGTLPYPVADFQMGFTQHEKDYPELVAVFGISPLCLNSFNFPNGWQLPLLNLLETVFAENDLELYTLKHEQSCIHVRINEVYAVRIALGSSTTEGLVDISLEPLDDLFEASEGELTFEPDPDDCDTPDIIETLRQFSQATSAVLDCTIGLLGEPSLEGKGKPTIAITTPADFASAEIVSAEDPEASSTRRTFDSIGGMERPRQRMREIAFSYKYPEEAALYNLKPSHILVHGVAGTGKTSLVEAFANEVEAKLQVVHSSDIIEKWVGQSVANLRKLFEAAMKDTSRQVLFFDEFDVLGKRGSQTNDERASVTKELGTLLDEVSRSHPNIIIVCAGNANIEHFEESLVRAGRLEAIAVTYPTESERVDIWAAVLTESLREFGYGNLSAPSKVPLVSGEPFIPYEDDINPLELAAETDGMVGADFVELLERTRRRKFMEYITKKHLPDAQPGRVSQRDLLEEIRQYHL